MKGRLFLALALGLLTASSHAAPTARVTADEMRSLIQSVARGNMSSEDMARALTGTNDPLFVAKPETVRRPVWLLDPERTLRDHLETWFNRAGYSVVWQASNYFAITKKVQVEGDFEDLLRLIQSSANLVILPDEKTKIVTITDAISTASPQ